MEPYRRVSALLPGETWKALVELCEREERLPGQQVAYIVKQSLAAKGLEAGARIDQPQGGAGTASR